METYRGIVRPQHLDHMGHMNVQWYAAKFDEATWHMFARLGMTPTYFRESGMGMAGLEQTTKYLSEAMAGDLLIVRSELKTLKEKTIVFVHHMFDETNKEIASIKTTAVHFDREKRKSCPFPDFVREKFEEANKKGRNEKRTS